jgi:hypothetical protein
MYKLTHRDNPGFVFLGRFGDCIAAVRMALGGNATMYEAIQLGYRMDFMGGRHAE